MQKIDIKKATGVGVLSLGLVVGLAGFAGATSGSIGTTGPSSDNTVRHDSDVELEVENDNDLDLTNRSEQRASSGETEVKYNTTGGDASTGDASNMNDVTAEVEFDNSASAASMSAMASVESDNSGSITNTGAYSDNHVTFESDTDVDIDNENDVDIYNNVDQSAYSGDAEVRANTTGGSASTGSVSNSSSSSFTVRITN